MRGSIQERFEMKCVPEPTSGCWLWVGCVGPKDYGVIARSGKYGGARLAHRVSWELYRGPIPDELCVLHKCDTPCCVNPDHLFLGAQADNVTDMHAKGRARKRGLKGEENHSTKLTADQVINIRSLARVQSKASIARQFEMSPATIKEIIARKIWRHI